MQAAVKRSFGESLLGYIRDAFDKEKDSKSTAEGIESCVTECIETRLNAIETQVHNKLELKFERRFTDLELKIASLETRFEKSFLSLELRLEKRFSEQTKWLFGLQLSCVTVVLIKLL